MGGAVEVARTHLLDDVGDRVLGEHHAAENGLLGRQILRWLPAEVLLPWSLSEAEPRPRSSSLHVPNPSYCAPDSHPACPDRSGANRNLRAPTIQAPDRFWRRSAETLRETCPGAAGRPTQPGLCTGLLTARAPCADGGEGCAHSGEKLGNSAELFRLSQVTALEFPQEKIVDHAACRDNVIGRVFHRSGQPMTASGR